MTVTRAGWLLFVPMRLRKMRQWTEDTRLRKLRPHSGTWRSRWWHASCLCVSHDAVAAHGWCRCASLLYRDRGSTPLHVQMVTSSFVEPLWIYW